MEVVREIRVNLNESEAEAVRSLIGRTSHRVRKDLGVSEEQSKLLAGMYTELSNALE